MINVMYNKSEGFLTKMGFNVVCALSLNKHQHGLFNTIYTEKKRAKMALLESNFENLF